VALGGVVVRSAGDSTGFPIPAADRDDVMEFQVVGDACRTVLRPVRRPAASARRRRRLSSRRRPARRRRLECPAHLEKVQRARTPMEIDDKAPSFPSRFRLQARQIGAVTLAHVQNADQRQRMNVRRQGVLADPRSSESIVGKHLSFDSVAETAARLNQLPPVARVPPVSRWFLISPNDFDDHRGKPWNGQDDRSGAEPIGRPCRRDRARCLDSVDDAAFCWLRCWLRCRLRCRVHCRVHCRVALPGGRRPTTCPSGDSSSNIPAINVEGHNSRQRRARADRR